MKLMFNKTTYEGHWFEDGEIDGGYTEKTPPHTGVVFNENDGEWVLKTEEAEDGEQPNNE